MEFRMIGMMTKHSVHSYRSKRRINKNKNKNPFHNSYVGIVKRYGLSDHDSLTVNSRLTDSRNKETDIITRCQKQLLDTMMDSPLPLIVVVGVASGGIAGLPKCQATLHLCATVLGGPRWPTAERALADFSVEGPIFARG